MKSIENLINDTHYLIVKCDENDGDYITRKIKFTPNIPKMILVAEDFDGNDFFDAPKEFKQKPLELFELVNYLIDIDLSLKAGKYIWSRREYDGISDASQTIKKIIEMHYGIDLYDGKYENIYDDVIEFFFKILNDKFFPFGDCGGFHSIESFEITPINSIIKFYESPTYWDRMENKLPQKNCVDQILNSISKGV